MKRAWLLPAIALAGCSAPPSRPQPIPVLAEQRQCPAYPLPPAALLKPPVTTDFLPTPPSSPPSKRSSSTR